MHIPLLISPLLIIRRLSCGTSWHAAGTIGTMRSTKLLTSMGLYALELYSELEDETGLGTGKYKSTFGFRPNFKS